MANLFNESLTLNPQTRAGLPGQFVALPDGVTHFEIAGPEDGPPVILIHGFSTPYMLWDRNFAALAEAGLRVVRYDLFGRGYSDRPAPPYDADRFDRQLDQLLDALGFGEPVALVGASMGAAIAATFADRHPQRVRRLALIGPAGFAVKPSLATVALFTPGVGEIVMALGGNKIILGGLPADFHQPGRFPEYYTNYAVQLPYQGFKRALLSTMRRMPLTTLGETYARIGQRGLPVLAIWGREDAVIPAATTAPKLQAAIPAAALHVIDAAGHNVQYERPEAVNPLLIDFLKG
jgi:pimeloyl-ACP methyl ester carboxylesterase